MVTNQKLSHFLQKFSVHLYYNWSINIHLQKYELDILII